MNVKCTIGSIWSTSHLAILVVLLTKLQHTWMNSQLTVRHLTFETNQS